MPRTRKSPSPINKTLPVTAVNGLPSEVLTLAEAAAYLRLAEPDVLCLIFEQGLPARQAGAEWRFLKTAIEQWLSTGLLRQRSSKDALLALAGKYRDDPDLLRICEEAYQRRGRPITENE